MTILFLQSLFCKSSFEIEKLNFVLQKKKKETKETCGEKANSILVICLISYRIIVLPVCLSPKTFECLRERKIFFFKYYTSLELYRLYIYIRIMYRQNTLPMTFFSFLIRAGDTIVLQERKKTSMKNVDIACKFMQTILNFAVKTK